MRSILIMLVCFLLSPLPAYAGELTGTASYYSRAGCLGCSEKFTMANGESLDDTRLTIALTPQTLRTYHLLNHYVGVINPTNKRFTIAKVTDSGGFGKYNRIADLGVAVKEELGCGSICSVIIIF